MEVKSTKISSKPALKKYLEAKERTPSGWSLKCSSFSLRKSTAFFRPLASTSCSTAIASSTSGTSKTTNSRSRTLTATRPVWRYSSCRGQRTKRRRSWRTRPRCTRTSWRCGRSCGWGWRSWWCGRWVSFRSSGLATTNRTWRRVFGWRRCSWGSCSTCTWNRRRYDQGGK